MTGKQMFDSMQYLEDELLEEGTRRRVRTRRSLYVCAAAACAALVLGAVLLVPGRTVDPSVPDGAPVMEASGEIAFTAPTAPPQRGGVPDETEPEPAKPAALAWNDRDPAADTQADASWVLVSEPLTAEQLADCRPEILREWMVDAVSGYAAYHLANGAGGLAYVELTFSSSGWPGTLTVRIRDKDAAQLPSCGMEWWETDKVDSLNGQEYRAYRLRYLHGEGDPERNPPEAWTDLRVVFEKENLEYTLLTSAAGTWEEQAGMDLAELLLCYAGTHAVPDLSEFHCGEHLLRDEELTWDEALADPDFGAYVPAQGPEGMALDFTRRYQFDTVENILTLYWENDGSYLLWHIKPVSWESERRRVTAAEIERYDLRLYAAPWTEHADQADWMTLDRPVFSIGELSEDLVNARTYVDYDGLPGMRFSVEYETGVLVELNAKGVAPAWIYETLTTIGN